MTGKLSHIADCRLGTAQPRKGGHPSSRFGYRFAGSGVAPCRSIVPPHETTPSRQVHCKYLRGLQKISSFSPDNRAIP
jgi:hypothetical protein